MRTWHSGAGTMPSVAEFEPSRNEPCLCGSGRKFKRCCAGTYALEAQDEATHNFNIGKHRDALMACRRHLTWYVLCHRAHTLPLRERMPVELAHLNSVDIEALSEIVEFLHRCYHATGKSEEFPLVLDRLEHAIEDPRWQHKTKRFRSLWWLLDKENPSAALAALDGIDIDECEDPDILALFLNVCPLQDLSFDQKVSICDRITTHSRSESVILHYSALKGISYCLVNEIEEGCSYIQEAIDTYQRVKKRDPSFYGRLQLAHALQVLGQFRHNPAHIRDAITQYQAVLADSPDGGYTTRGLAEVEKSIADCRYKIGEYEEAAAMYRQSLLHADADLTKVFLARTHTELGDLNDARNALTAVVCEGLGDHAFFDYAMSWAMLAVKSLAKKDLETAKSHLKKARSYWPFFTTHRDSVLIDLLETSPARSPGILSKITGLLNRYVSVKPNIFGIGVDLNRAIEDAQDVKRGRARHGSPPDNDA